MELFPLVSALLICSSFIPAYELFVATVIDAAPGVAILWLGVILVVQCMAWILVECIVQLILYASSAPEHLFVVYSSYLVVAWHNHDWNMLLTCLRGTYFIRFYLWLMGSRIEGELWYFGSHIYDFPKLSFENKTVVDDAHILGHYVVFGNVVLDDTRVGGVVHPGTYCTAGARRDGQDESGPWRVFVGGGDGEKLEDSTEDDSLLLSDSDHSYHA